jgi:hypothetical protein
MTRMNMTIIVDKQQLGARRGVEATDHLSRSDSGEAPQLKLGGISQKGGVLLPAMCASVSWRSRRIDASIFDITERSCHRQVHYCTLAYSIS